jgi:hypothetical protein
MAQAATCRLVGFEVRYLDDLAVQALAYAKTFFCFVHTVLCATQCEGFREMNRLARLRCYEWFSIGYHESSSLILCARSGSLNLLASNDACKSGLPAQQLRVSWQPAATPRLDIRPVGGGRRTAPRAWCSTTAPFSEPTGLVILMRRRHEGTRVEPTKDREFRDALKWYTAARLAFRSVADSIARRLADGRSPTDDEVLAEQEARSAIGAALRRVSASFAKPRNPAER